MNYNNITWDSVKYEQFINYLLTYTNTLEKRLRRETIIKTNTKVLGIYSKEINLITNELKNSNIESFLNEVTFKYYEESMIYGNLLIYLNSFDKIKDHLNRLSFNTDNWATCDNIPFKKMIKKYEEQLFNEALIYIKSDLVFQRRIGLKIFFEYINKKELKTIFESLNTFTHEQEYYVNMIIGWLLCDCFIKQREQTINFLNSHKLNAKAINMFVQKCRDSFRVSASDKEMLLKYKGN